MVKVKWVNRVKNHCVVVCATINRIFAFRVPSSAIVVELDGLKKGYVRK